MYAERAVLIPSAVDPVNGYRSYDADQIVDGVTLDLLRRARIPLEDLTPDCRFQFDDHRGRLAMRRAMEDFYLDLAERVATADPSSLVANVRDAGPAHWIACEVPFGVSSDPEDLEETFTALTVDLPNLDRILLETLRAEGIELVAESWTASVSGTVPRMRLAHRVQDPVPPDSLRRVAEAAAPHIDASVRIASGTLPTRQELVHSLPDATPTDDPGLDDTALSYLATIAFAHRITSGHAEALDDAARRRASSTSMFDPSVTAEDVYDLAADGTRAHASQ
ncbi:MerR family transcriptional regulator (plasmid) [Clavibacter sepedonicus]|uniref:MerR family transcriptional regulator n=1 Tax=Clavibacter sepedonicus TaxID=31964 RepID=UPI0002F17072|nr:MerR family transcriptional regulator [Clavibacter sepedonicus]UUK67284.1 MerR family transcriptional regulator [Clavibacter sepedonicus]